MQAAINTQPIDFLQASGYVKPRETAEFQASGTNQSFEDFLKLAQKETEPVKNEQKVSYKDESSSKIQENQNSLKSENSSEENKSADSVSEKNAKTEKAEEKPQISLKSKAEEKTVQPENPGKELKASDKNQKNGVSVKDFSKQNSQKVQNVSVNEKLLSEAKVSDKNLSKDEKLLSQKISRKISENPEAENEIQKEMPELLLQNNLSLSKTNPYKDEIVSDSDFEVKGVKAKNFKLDKDGKIEVTDLRTKVTEAEDKSDAKKNDLKFSQPKLTSQNNAEINVELTGKENAEANLLSSNAQNASADGSNFQAMLSNQITEHADELVKAGNIVLKDNDVGSIKLILKPEELGNVKIDLQLKDNQLSGKIVVQSQAAFEAFKEGADNLKNAFMQNGFDNVNLDLSFAGQNQQNKSSQNQNPDYSYAMQRTYSEFTGQSVIDSGYDEEILQNSSLNSVNIVA